MFSFDRASNHMWWVRAGALFRLHFALFTHKQTSCAVILILVIDILCSQKILLFAILTTWLQKWQWKTDVPDDGKKTFLCSERVLYLDKRDILQKILNGKKAKSIKSSRKAHTKGRKSIYIYKTNFEYYIFYVSPWLQTEIEMY